MVRELPSRRGCGDVTRGGQLAINGVVAIVALFALAGCSNDDSLSGSVSLDVQQRRTGIMYTEGSISYVRVEAMASATTKGGVVEKSQRTRDQASLVKLSVPAGPITVKIWQRPCDGNCDHLDAPTDRCEVSFVAAENTRVIVRMTYIPGQSCTTDVEGNLAQQ